MRGRLVTVAAVFALMLAGSAQPAMAKGCKGRTIKGTAKADTLKGTCGPDKILGRGGNDKIVGGGGNDKLVGGPGSDSLSGGPGKDKATGSAGDDTLLVGNGVDTVDGGPGNDSAQYVGTISSETLTIAAASGRLSLTVGTNGVNGAAVESMTVKTGGGIDTVTVGELASAGLGELSIDLGEGDGAPDRAIFNGSPAADAIGVVAGGRATEITMLDTPTKLSGTRPTTGPPSTGWEATTRSRRAATWPRLCPSRSTAARATTA